MRRSLDDDTIGSMVEHPSIEPGSAPGLEDVEEPVRRFFRHAVGADIGSDARVRLTMRGRVKAGPWLPFTAEQDLDASSFACSARVGIARATPPHVVDRLEDAAGTTDGRDVHEERRLGGIALPARFSVGRGFGTPRYKPLFRTEITAAQAVAR